MKRQKDHEEDVPFDVEPATPSAPVESHPAPKDLLSASKVEAVRFHPAKPGYAYDQVETFVDAVTRTLKYLEHRMYQDDLALHEAENENHLLEEQVSTLKATIEVFRANGDPVGTTDGGFATASTVEDPALRAERDALAAALAASQAEVADLRAYIDEQLAPWIAEQESANADVEDAATTQVLAEHEPAAQDVDTQTAEPFEEEDGANPVVSHSDDDVALEPVEEPALEPASPSTVDEKAVFAATAAAFAAQVDDDWDDIEDDDEFEPEFEVAAPSIQPSDNGEHLVSGPMFSTPEIEALGVEIDPAKVIRTDDSQYERVSPPKAGTPLPRLLPPEIAAMMEYDDPR